MRNQTEECDDLNNAKINKNDRSTCHRLCSICLEKLSDNDEIYATECIHLFHIDCILLW